MRTIHILVILFVFIFAGISCSDDDPIELPGDIEVNLKSEWIIEADNQFGLELFSKINDEEANDKNIMISPISVSLALAMAYNGANGNTREQMEVMLHKLDLTPNEINQSYKYLVEALESHDPKVELSIANAIFHHDQFVLKDEFKSTNKSYYNAEIDALDFSNSTFTLDKVNGWVKKQTRDKIESIIDQVSPNDVMYLINAIYFNAEWTYKFDTDNTADRIFFLDDGNEIMTPTMYIEEEFNYLNTEDFEILELPYGGKKYSMLIFLPHENKTTEEIIESLTPEDFNNWLNEMKPFNKKVFLPKLEFAYENSLVDNLKSLGMTDAFDAGLSDFSGISDARDLFISEVKHKSYIKLDERGTEAAAVTGITVEVTSTQPNQYFAVDHPFVFSIYEEDTDAILFLGKVTNPSKKE